MLHVALPGCAPALAQLMGNLIPLMFDGSVTSKPLIPCGKVKLLAVDFKNRWSEYPNDPMLAKLGYPEMDFSNWTGVFASAKMPQSVMEKIHATIQKIKARCHRAGALPRHGL